jgi:hypothetical protein
MDGLPAELCIKIFHLLDHQSLASAPQGALFLSALFTALFLTILSASFLPLSHSDVSASKLHHGASSYLMLMVRSLT